MISDCISGYIAETPFFSMASASLQGRRKTDEDATDYILTERYTFFAIYDGHNGDSCSAYLKKHLLKEMSNLEELSEENITELYRKIDLDFMQVTPSAGSTAVVVVLDNKKKCAMVINRGDSIATISRGFDVIYVTKDHTPNSEEKRIREAGGWVMQGRIFGSLAVSRAFGDFTYKDPKPTESPVINTPTISEWIKLEDNDIIILNCDGLNEGYYMPDAIATIFTHDLKERNDNVLQTVLKTIAGSLDESHDNISMTAIKIKPKETSLKFVDEIRNPPTFSDIYIPGFSLSMTNFNDYSRIALKNGFTLSQAYDLRKGILEKFFEGTLGPAVNDFLKCRFYGKIELLKKELEQLMNKNDS